MYYCMMVAVSKITIAYVQNIFWQQKTRCSWNWNRDGFCLWFGYISNFIIVYLPHGLFCLFFIIFVWNNICIKNMKCTNIPNAAEMYFIFHLTKAKRTQGVWCKEERFFFKSKQANNRIFATYQEIKGTTVVINLILHLVKAVRLQWK